MYPCNDKTIVHFPSSSFADFYRCTLKMNFIIITRKTVKFYRMFIPMKDYEDCLIQLKIKLVTEIIVYSKFSYT